MVLMVAALLSAVQVSSARIVIDIEQSRATVGIDYAFVASVDSLSLSAMRWPTQVISLDATATDLVATDQGGLLRIEPSAPGRASLRLLYSVTGNIGRIPLFVPNVPTVAGSDPVTIVVRNAPRDVSLVDAFPRLTREGDGSLLGRPANIPSFVLVPAAANVSRARLADAAVVLLLLAATTFWVVRQARGAR